VRYWAVQIAGGRWMSRGRFDSAWDGSFQLAHPELFDSEAAALKAAEGQPSPVVVLFETHERLEARIAQLETALYGSLALCDLAVEDDALHWDDDEWLEEARGDVKDWRAVLEAKR
jgi:hypothetical protein